MKLQKIWLVFVLLVLLWGCSKQATVRRYYVVEMPPPEEPTQTVAEDFQFDDKVDVRDFWVARAFDQTRIALRTQSHELTYYFYHHWAVKPSTAVADIVYEWLQQQHVFSRLARGITYNPDYAIVGEIKSLERVENDAGTFAHVHVRLELREGKSEKVLVQFETDQMRALENSKSMNLFAERASEIMISITKEFYKRVQAYLEKQQGTL